MYDFFFWVYYVDTSIGHDTAVEDQPCNEEVIFTNENYWLVALENQSTSQSVDC